MSEKMVENKLSTYLNAFDQSNIYYAPSENPTLKEIFKKASKKGAGIGIPDRIYYDGKILIVFECKRLKLLDAKKDLEIYKNKMIIADMNDLGIYYVAFAKDIYEIYNSELKKLDINLIPSNFGIKNNNIMEYTPQNMTKDLHDLHNYIRDYTKISNEDKSFFVACILISLKKESFCKILENYDTKLYIYDIVRQNLIDLDIDVSVFEFLRNDDNNMHFLNIIKMIKNIYDQNPSMDLLNQFYSEFVKYSNTDSKSLGIVLTPDHIVKLMIKLLDINHKDTFLDLCTGTGSFPLEALRYNPESIIACEYQTKLYGLLKCNMILREVDLGKNDIIHGDCFEYDFKATKSAINPPYGMKDKRELDFVLKQLESVKENGLVCAIVPCSCLSNSNNRNLLFDKTIIKKIVICNNDLFYPNAGVKTCIILLKKQTHTLIEQEIILDNFEQDGFQIQRNKGRINVNNEVHVEQFIKITKDNETWLHYDIEHPIDKLSLHLKLLETEYNTKKLNYLKLQDQNEDAAMPITNFKAFKISELFDILKKPKKKYDNSTKELIYEISAKNNNNGIKGVVDSTENTFTGNKIVLVTGGNGGAGLAYYQETNFIISSSTVVLSPKETFHMDKLMGIYIATELSKYKSKYSRGFQWNLARIQNDTIELPVCGGTGDTEIDYQYIDQLYNCPQLYN
jgi:predicted RNA methylase